MNTRRACAENVPQIKRLWAECFHDEEDYVNRFLEQFGIDDIVILLDGSKLCSMASLLPVRYVQADGAEQKGAYLYAACTEPSYRNKGCFRKLHEYAQQLLREEGCDFVFLRPAEEGLAAMYETLGYSSLLMNDETVVAAQEQPQTKLTQLSAEDYLQFRQLLLRSEFIDWPLRAVAYQQALGTLLCLTQADKFAIAAVERNCNRIFVKEYLGDAALSGAIPAHFGVASAVFRTVGETPFAMVKALSDKPIPTGYPGYVFD